MLSELSSSFQILALLPACSPISATAQDVLPGWHDISYAGWLKAAKC